MYMYVCIYIYVYMYIYIYTYLGEIVEGAVGHLVEVEEVVVVGDGSLIPGLRDRLPLRVRTRCLPLLGQFREKLRI